MHNCEYKIAGEKLVITIDIGKAAIAAAPPSKSGKTNLLATTGGAIVLPSRDAKLLTFALNVMVKP